jgi:hypothetical protein
MEGGIKGDKNLTYEYHYVFKTRDRIDLKKDWHEN